MRTNAWWIAALTLGLPAMLVAQQAAEVVEVSTDPYTNAGSQHATQVEPALFAHDSTVVVAFQSGRYRSGGGASDIGWATSQDGGTTWVDGFLPSLTVNSEPAGPYARTSDPTVAYDAKDGVWMIASLARQGTSWRAVVVNRSADGLTWEAPVVVSATPSGSYDKGWVACDNWPASPFYGFCYATWDDGNGRIRVTTSRDGGLTWDPNAMPAGAPGGIGGIPVPQPDGRVIVPGSSPTGGQIIAFQSADGGLTWSKASVVSDSISHRVAGGLRAPTPLPSASVDATGQVYVVWPDCRFRLQCSANDLVMSTSADGTTWSPAVRIPIDATSSGVDHFLPGIAADPSTGGETAELALTYYYYPKAACTASTCRLHVGFVSSTNGGAAWSAPRTLAGPMNLSWLPRTNQGRMVGDYISTSLAGSVALSPFAVAEPNAGTLFAESIHVARVTIVTAGSPVVAAPVDDPVLSVRSDHPVRTRLRVTP